MGLKDFVNAAGKYAEQKLNAAALQQERANMAGPYQSRYAKAAYMLYGAINDLDLDFLNHYDSVDEMNVIGGIMSEDSCAYQLNTKRKLTQGMKDDLLRELRKKLAAMDGITPGQSKRLYDMQVHGDKLVVTWK